MAIALILLALALAAQRRPDLYYAVIGTRPSGRPATWPAPEAR
jgi:hypothetical protein